MHRHDPEPSLEGISTRVLDPETPQQLYDDALEDYASDTEDHAFDDGRWEMTRPEQRLAYAATLRANKEAVFGLDPCSPDILGHKIDQQLEFNAPELATPVSGEVLVGDFLVGAGVLRNILVHYLAVLLAFAWTPIQLALLTHLGKWELRESMKVAKTAS